MTDSQRPTEHSDLPIERFTIREIDVVRLLAEGLCEKQIAGRLGTKRCTIHTHIMNMYKKSGAACHMTLVLGTLRWGYL